MTDRDRLIELFKKIEYTPFPEMTMKSNLGNQFNDYALSCIVDSLLANGVRVIDTKFINPENRELITHFAGMPINDVLDLVRAKKEGKLIVPPCKIGQTVYVPINETSTIFKTKVLAIGVDEDGDFVLNPYEYPDDVFCVNGANIGKTVFLIKEEAEAELRNRSKNNAT